jgi:hypothetical protein
LQLQTMRAPYQTAADCATTAELAAELQPAGLADAVHVTATGGPDSAVDAGVLAPTEAPAEPAAAGAGVGAVAKPVPNDGDISAPLGSSTDLLADGPSTPPA